jgi:integrase/recombinase XerC/integrase/recombinase XerD
MMTTACRVSELCGVKLRDCTVQDEKVFVRIMGKGRKERRVQIAKSLYDFIRETFRGEEWLFETKGGKPYHRNYVSNEVKKLGRDFLGKCISAHTLRHSRITHWVQNYPGSIDAISRYAGHSNVSITLGMYCHGQMSDEMLFDLDEV